MTVKNDWVDGDSVNAAAMNAVATAVNAGSTPADGSITFPKLAAAAVVTASETIAANNNDTTIPTSAAVQAAIALAVTGLLDFKGATDCSANPNYPSASKGDAYVVTVAGKIGGASGKSVDIGDLYLATADNAGGTEASVGTSWAVLEHNLVGALLAANNLSDVGSAVTARSNIGADQVLVPTAVKTSAYTAAAGDLVVCDATTAFAVTLPAAPADKSRVAVKMVLPASPTSSQVITIAAAGSDVFNKSGGSTSLTLTQQNQAAVLQYKASGAIWYVVSTDVPLDPDIAAFAAIASGDGFAKRIGSVWAPVPMLSKTDVALPVSITEDAVALNTATTASTPGTSATVMTVSVAASGLSVGFTHWQNDETDPATTITFNASIRIAGTIYRLTFNGRTTAVLDPGGQIVTDEIGVNVAVGDTVEVRTFLASGTAYAPRAFTGSYSAKGGFTATTDLTAPGSGSIALTSTAYCYGPSTVLGHPDPGGKSVYLLGDSILRGTGDGWGGATASQVPAYPQRGMAGFGVRALAGKTGIVQAARNSDQAQVAATAASLRRLSLVTRCTSAIIELGINDLGTRTPAQLQGDLLTCAKMMRRNGIPKVFLTTITPYTTSTDAWATVGNQTVTSSNTNRITHNNWVRGGCPVNASTLAPVTVGTGGALLAGSAGHPITGYFEVADTVESARDSGKWKAARRTVSTGAMTNGAYELNATGAAFVAGLISAGGDVGTTINVVGAGTAGAVFRSFVDTRNSATQVSFLDPAETTVSGAVAAIGVMTGDGIHPTTDGHLLMSAAIDTTVL